MCCAIAVLWENVLVLRGYRLKYLELKSATYFKKCINKGFPGGAVVERLPADAGDTGSSPGPERSHMLWSN